MTLEINTEQLRRWMEVDVERLERSIRVKQEYIKMNGQYLGPNGKSMHFIAKEAAIYRDLVKLLTIRTRGWGPVDLLDPDPRFRELALEYMRK